MARLIRFFAASVMCALAGTAAAALPDAPIAVSQVEPVATPPVAERAGASAVRFLDIDVLDETVTTRCRNGASGGMECDIQPLLTAMDAGLVIRDRLLVVRSNEDQIEMSLDFDTGIVRRGGVVVASLRGFGGRRDVSGFLDAASIETLTGITIPTNAAAAPVPVRPVPAEPRIKRSRDSQSAELLKAAYAPANPGVEPQSAITFPSRASIRSAAGPDRVSGWQDTAAFGDVFKSAVALDSPAPVAGDWRSRSSWSLSGGGEEPLKAPVLRPEIQVVSVDAEAAGRVAVPSETEGLLVKASVSVEPPSPDVPADRSAPQARPVTGLSATVSAYLASWPDMDIRTNRADAISSALPRSPRPNPLFDAFDATAAPRPFPAAVTAKPVLGDPIVSKTPVSTAYRGQVHGNVFIDHDGDGKAGPDDERLEGLALMLIDSAGRPDERLTAAFGQFGFTGLAPGPYQLRVLMGWQEHIVSFDLEEGAAETRVPVAIPPEPILRGAP